MVDKYKLGVVLFNQDKGIKNKGEIKNDGIEFKTIKSQ